MTIETELNDASAEGTDLTEAGWRGKLSDDLREHPALGGFEDVGALAREHVHLQKLIGRKGILPPGEGATEEDYSRYYDALGRPEDPSGYDLTEVERPEGLPWSAEIETEMLARMHRAGLTNDQARALMESYVDLQGTTWSQLQASQSQALESAVQELRSEWGGAYDARLDVANRAFAMAFGDQVEDVRQLRLADGGFLGDHPQLVRAFAAIGARMSEAEFVGEGAMPGGHSREQARAQLEELESDATFRTALLDRSHPDHRQSVQRRSQLTDQAYGARDEQVADLRL